VATVAELMRSGIERLRASGSETPRLDVELLLGHAIGVDRTVVAAYPDAPVSTEAEARFEADLVRREAGEPVAYIRGFKEFFGLAFATDRRALIPRPETELVVDRCLELLVGRDSSAPRPPGGAPLLVADVGTGAGTIAVALGAQLRRRGMLGEVVIIGTEDEPETLGLARENAVGHGVGDRVRFLEADLLPPVVANPFDLVLANLPYVRSDAVPTLPVAASFEPVAALDGGPDGLRVISRLLDQLPTGLAGDGAALLEIGGDQGDEIGPLVAERQQERSCEVERDLAGLPRVAIVRRAPAAGTSSGAA